MAEYSITYRTLNPREDAEFVLETIGKHYLSLSLPQTSSSEYIHCILTR